MADPTEAEREIDAMVERIGEMLASGIIIEDDGFTLPKSVVRAALATARETAQREAEARLVEVKKWLEKRRDYFISETAFVYTNMQVAHELDILARALPLPASAERWEKLREAIKAVPLGALAEDIRLRDATRVALLGLINALAAFGEGEWT